MGVTTRTYQDCNFLVSTTSSYPRSRIISGARFVSIMREELEDMFRTTKDSHDGSE